MDITSFLDKVNRIILNPVITLIFAVAFLIFFYGLFEFIRGAAKDDVREEGKRKIVYGLIGMLIMFGVYGIIRVVLGTFGIHSTYLGI